MRNYANRSFLLSIDENYAKIKPLIANPNLKNLSFNEFVDKLIEMDIDELELKLSNNLSIKATIIKFSDDTETDDFDIDDIFLSFDDRDLFFEPIKKPIMEELEKLDIEPEEKQWVSFG